MCLPTAPPDPRSPLPLALPPPVQIPTIGFIYFAGWLGFSGTKYLQATRDKNKEIIIDVPLAWAKLWEGLAWPLRAAAEAKDGSLFEAEVRPPVWGVGVGVGVGGGLFEAEVRPPVWGVGGQMGGQAAGADGVWCVVGSWDGTAAAAGVWGYTGFQMSASADAHNSCATCCLLLLQENITVSPR